MKRSGQSKHANYYESILQLRNPDDEVIGFTNDAIKAQEDVSLAKRKKVKNGFDYYLSSNKFAIELGRYLYNTYGGDLKITKKLFSQHRQTSKILYRMTVLFRMSEFKVGDFVFLEGKAYKLTSFSRKTYVAMGLETSKQVELKYEDLLRNAEKLAPQSVLIAKTMPHLEIIHPETFQSVPVLPLRKSNLIPGERIKVIVHEDTVWKA